MCIGDTLLRQEPCSPADLLLPLFRSIQKLSKRTLASKSAVASHLVSVHIKPERQQGLHAFWTEQRGVQSPAMLARLRNFAGIYPRYRDLGYLKQTMTVRHTSSPHPTLAWHLIFHNRKRRAAHQLAVVDNSYRICLLAEDFILHACI